MPEEDTAERHDDFENRKDRLDAATRPATFAPAGVAPGRKSELSNETNPPPQKK